MDGILVRDEDLETIMDKKTKEVINPMYHELQLQLNELRASVAEIGQYRQLWLERVRNKTSEPEPHQPPTASTRPKPAVE